MVPTLFAMLIVEAARRYIPPRWYWLGQSTGVLTLLLVHYIH